VFDHDRLLASPPFSLDRTAKAQVYREALSDLTRLHYDACPPYRRLLDVLAFDVRADHAGTDQPFLPVRAFKTHELASVAEDQIIKTMTSSGTTGQQVSRIFLDKVTSARQTKVLAKITASVLGPKRLPMLIIDSKAVVNNRSVFSARGAGILGFSMLGSDPTYALDDDMRLDLAAVEAFLAKHAGSPVFIFGFTFMIWQHLVQALAAANQRLSLERGIVLHGGGWKKLAEQAVDNHVFKARLHELCGIERVHNYYGMVEQTGSIFIECNHGRLHCSDYSDVIMRRPADFSACAPGETGLIQLVSLLPSSYPGHSLLSEDLGQVTGEDDCPCGRYGKTFVIHGRVKNAELRGCSDTYAAARVA
jgi:phenylacetate-coenzyme A ligase PaaK-like adenylate-forming protein